MESFLRLTAQHLYQHYGDRLSDIAVIFPNNRAKLFFSEHLLELAGKPIWTPSFLTINNLFESQSTLKVADTLSLVARLYKTFQEVSQQPESFDEFYLWGELLLSDFDDVDKNLADATQLFRNIKEQAAFTDTLEHLSEEQVSIIRRFFDHFDPSRKTELKRRFIENWNCLMQVYSSFKETLEHDGLAYEGMLNRKVVEGLRKNEGGIFSYEKYAFVGFNVLNQCEKELFNHLLKQDKALFFWDYDNSYLQVNNHEAGRFMRQNLEHFPNQLGAEHFDAFIKNRKHLDFVASASENAQARYLPEWIKSLGPGFKPEETAVVLCNESLLLPVLHSIPETVSELNVTMGFPLSQAPVSNLINRVCLMHTSGVQTDKKGVSRFNFRYLLPILQHPLVVMSSAAASRVEAEIKQQNLFRVSTRILWQDAFLEELFTPVNNSVELAERLMNVLSNLSRKKAAEPSEEEDSQQDDPLFQESIFQCYTLISRLRDTLNEGLVEVGMPVFTSLLQRVISVTSIPFSGEPVRGMQIMGMLETRTLDFKNVLILSVNEGMLPKSANDVSFIPYNLRKGFGLTTSDHKDSIFAYYFYRLLQRAEHITLAYNTSSDGLNRGEMSRFMLQLLVDAQQPISCYQLHTTMGLSSARNLRVDKSTHLMDTLCHRFNSSTGNHLLSPTALNTYIDCPLRFYFRYVANLKEEETISDEIDGAMLGTCFHHAAEYLYTDILLRKAGKRPGPVEVEAARREKTIQRGLKEGTIQGTICPADLEPWIASVHSIDKLARYVMGINFFHLKPESEETPEFSGEQLIRLRLLTHFLRTFVELEKQEAPFELVGMETQVEYLVPIETINGRLLLRLGGTIDRMHYKDGTWTVVDYKTGGGDAASPDSIEALFRPKPKRASHIFQLLTYCAILHRTKPEWQLNPKLLYINKAGADDYSGDIQLRSGKDKVTLADYAPHDDLFWGELQRVLHELFNPAVPFVQCEALSSCEYCDYKAICKR